MFNGLVYFLHGSIIRGKIMADAKCGIGLDAEAIFIAKEGKAVESPLSWTLTYYPPCPEQLSSNRLQRVLTTRK
jgi:hypothetical protein